MEASSLNVTMLSDRELLEHVAHQLDDVMQFVHDVQQAMNNMPKLPFMPQFPTFPAR